MQVVVCDDHRLFGEALASVLTFRGHDVAAYVESPEDAVSITSRGNVDLVVMDVLYRSGSGLHAIEAIKAGSPSTDVIVLTSAADEETRTRAIKAGARACIEKQVSLEAVVDVVEHPATEGYIGADSDSKASGSEEWTAASLAKFLTPREWQVLRALAHGESTAAIADRLRVGHATARTHVQNLLAKLGVHSRLEAVLFAVENELIRPDEFTADRRLGA